MEGRSIAASGHKPRIEWAATVAEGSRSDSPYRVATPRLADHLAGKVQWTENMDLAMDIGDPDGDGRRREEREGRKEIQRPTSSPVTGFSRIELRSLGPERSVKYNGGSRIIQRLLRRPSRVMAGGFVRFWLNFVFSIF